MRAANEVNAFLREHYGEDIAYSLQQTVSDRLVVKYCKNLFVPENVPELNADYCFTQDYIFKDEEFRAICFSGPSFQHKVLLQLKNEASQYTYSAAEGVYLSDFGIESKETDCYFLIPEKDLKKGCEYEATLFLVKEDVIISAKHFDILLE